MLDFLKQQGIDDSLIARIQQFRKDCPVAEGDALRIPSPRFRYYGREIWQLAITAILSGENILLVGPKATGKNVLAENLSAVFGRPEWDVSFYLNTDATSLIGTDTFRNGEVSFRKGPIYACAEAGGFGVLDEINMAKNESLAVLHATLDFRRIIDVPGYSRIRLAPSTRFIATMNYGYAGTPTAMRGPASSTKPWPPVSWSSTCPSSRARIWKSCFWSSIPLSRRNMRRS